MKIMFDTSNDDEYLAAPYMILDFDLEAFKREYEKAKACLGINPDLVNLTTRTPVHKNYRMIDKLYCKDEMQIGSYAIIPEDFNGGHPFEANMYCGAGQLAFHFWKLSSEITLIDFSIGVVYEHISEGSTYLINCALFLSKVEEQTC